eukprot:g7195.t1
MLNAEKDVLSSALYKSRNEIKRLDLDNLYSFLSSLSTQAALLAGFAFGALQPNDLEYSFWNIMLQIFVIITLGAEMYVVCNGMLVSVLGPNMALNGPKGSMERAVYVMRKERGAIFKMFGIGLLGFFGMIVCLAVIYMPTGLAIVCVPLSAGFAIYTIVVSRRILLQFQFDEPVYTERVRVGEDSNPLIASLPSERKSAINGNISAAEFLKITEPNAGKFVKTEDASEEHNVGRKSKITNNTPATNLLSSFFEKSTGGKKMEKPNEAKKGQKKEAQI